MITAVTAIPYPSGGAVQLLIHTDQEYASALILATPTPDVPDAYADIEPRPMTLPDMVMPVRLVHSGLLKIPAKYRIKHGRHTYMIMDLDSDVLPDDGEVFYHVFDENNGHYGEPITISVTPQCARTGAATLARVMVMRRLRYHAERAIRDGILPFNQLPVLEKEQRVEGEDIPAILVRETATPNPSVETVGHQAGHVTHPDGNTTSMRRYAYRVRVDILGLTDNPGDRLQLEKWFKETLPADVDFYQHGGIEEPQFSFFPNHVIAPDSTDEYTIEATFEGNVFVTISEEQVRRRDNTVLR